MFVQSDGATALRSELVQALYISQGSATYAIEGEVRPACAALGGVWNGRKGYVVLLVRVLEPAQLVRFSYSHPLETSASLQDAIEEGLAFAEMMGFALVGQPFRELEPEQQRERMAAWDSLRKLERTPLLPGETSKPGTPRSRQVLARIPVVTRALDAAGGTSALGRLLAQL
jgi:hypothetical protein